MKPCGRCGEQFDGHWSAHYCDACRGPAHSASRLAHGIVACAIKKGRLSKADQQICVDCGAPAEVLEHRNYASPLEVSPVCCRCNQQRGPAKHDLTRKQSGLGRPKKLPRDSHPVLVMMGPEERATALELGKGNLSAGVRLAIALMED